MASKILCVYHVQYNVFEVYILWKTKSSWLTYVLWHIAVIFVVRTLFPLSAFSKNILLTVVAMLYNKYFEFISISKWLFVSFDLCLFNIHLIPCIHHSTLNLYEINLFWYYLWVRSCSIYLDMANFSWYTVLQVQPQDFILSLPLWTTFSLATHSMKNP